MTSGPTLVADLAQPTGTVAARADTAGADAWQGQVGATRRMRVRALGALRGLFILGELMIVLVVWQVLRWPFAILPCVGLIAASISLNLAVAVSPMASREARPWEVTAVLAFDILQLTALLWFTGGVLNPFALMLMFPISVGGNALPPRHSAGLCVLAVGAALVLAMQWGRPAWAAALETDTHAYLLSRALALIVALVFAAAYAAWSSARSARRELALHVTETVLAREQRLSALGALSAVIAHELGTPLATMAIVATEMAREAPAGPMRDDANLMVEQARRCRDILRRLAEEPETPDAMHERMSLLQFVREIVEPYAKASDVRVEAVVTGPPDVAAPDLWRRPEVLHAISTMVENAFDFARREILLTVRFDLETISVEVRDDGPGFAPAILARLGEPYVTSRPGAEGSRTGHVGMGLGVFIAKTLLERSGARIGFSNGASLGAIVMAKWPRARLEAPAADY